MKRSSLIILALCGALAAAASVAEDTKPGYSSVVLRTQTGETTTITLTDNMSTKFTETDIVFDDGQNMVSLPLAKLRSYTFTEAVIPEGIDAVPIVGEAEAVYSADGRRVPSLSGAPAGLYIVKNGKTTLKIYHK